MAKGILAEAKRRIAYLDGAGFRHAPSRYLGFLEWLESEPSTHAIVTKLIKDVDIDLLLKDCNWYRHPQPKSPEEVARIGLTIFETCRERPNDLPGLLCVLGCQGGQGNFELKFADAIAKFVNPFLRLLQDELQAAADSLQLDAIVAYRRETLLDAAFQRSFPETSRLLDGLSKEMTAFTDSQTWYNIANSCREVLKSFSGELLTMLNTQREENLKAGDFKGIARHVLSKRMREGRARDALLTLTAAAWDYIQSLLHNSAATRAEALRVYLWTGMVIAEVFEQARRNPAENATDTQ